MDMGVGIHLKIITISKNRVLNLNNEIFCGELDENPGRILKEKE